MGIDLKKMFYPQIIICYQQLKPLKKIDNFLLSNNEKKKISVYLKCGLSC